MPRTKNQEGRRTTLRHAAARAIVARGSSSISLRDVATEAGVSPSSVLYYYPDLDELVSEAIQQAMERFYDRRHATAEALSDPREQLVTTIMGGFPSGSDDLDVLLLYLGVPVIRRSRPIAALMRSLTGRQVGLYRSILEVGAAQAVFHLVDDSWTIAANLVALEDAYGLYVMNGNGSHLGRYIGRTISYASVATSCPLGDLASAPGSEAAITGS